MYVLLREYIYSGDKANLKVEGHIFTLINDGNYKGKWVGVFHYVTYGQACDAFITLMGPQTKSPPISTSSP